MEGDAGWAGLVRPSIISDYYLLIKRDGFDAKGLCLTVRLTARQSACALLEQGIWPLWVHTKNRKAIAAGDLVAIYLSGDGGGRVIAFAKVEQVAEWSHSQARSYPLMLDGTPFSVLKLNNIGLLREPVAVKERLGRLSFVNASSKKWGVAFMGGCRAIGEADFGVLTSPAV